MKRAKVGTAVGAVKARIWLTTGLVAAGLAGLAAFVGITGCTSTPTALESRFYNIDTNRLPRVVWVTNVVQAEERNPKSEIRSSETGTGEWGQTNGGGLAGPKSAAGVMRPGATADRLVLPLQVPILRTNVTMVTNYDEVYTYTPNERAQSVSAVAGSAAGLLGPVGELVALLCAGAFGVWGQLRSSRATRVAGVLAQVIETGRAVLQTTAQGKELDQKWKSWMIEHQAEQGVIQDVVALLGKAVDSQTAQETAAKLLALMQERSGAATKGNL